ncbi:Cyclin-D-binding Myb-like transcription factor 1 [Myotis brandtii]|uniref:Cyclin-D-binding Myb-like transcription factor 1 n=1 Tax=Myotis brandtii TaxID=109478 RepID=S7NC05_MYOBR|nr:Cyclin-D-binding Myb-like transcription factor 1 [Myotis brandtii]
MSTVEEDSDTVTVETVNFVTLTRDIDGNLILHCPQNEADEIDSEDSTEPLHKRLCLSSEDDQSIDDSAPCISVVALPLSENDQSFEVTMTATTEVADDEITEGTVTQIQILQNEQLDEISPLGNEEVSAVSQAWFTTKEDKDSLTNKGKWTEEEEKRLAEVVHELTSTEPGDIVTQGVSWAAVAERVGTRSEKQCRSKWLNYLNWKQSGGTEWTKEDEINLILSDVSACAKYQIEGVETEVLYIHRTGVAQAAAVQLFRCPTSVPHSWARIAELDVADENDINWDLLAEGWSSVRSPQWLRISENDQSFEVTMTATTEVADDEITEGTVTQIQILQNEQLDEISPLGNEEVSAVSQAWFTTKEDKDSLTNKGHKWKQGMWSKEEIGILMNNIERYLKARGIKDATEVIFEMSKDERKDFYRTIAWGLNRPLFAVYRRVLRMYDDRNHVGKYTPEEIEKLKELRIKHGNDWATIGAALGRSASSVKDRCRLMKDTCNTGKWTEEEEKRLAEVVHELTSTEPGDIVTQGVSWAAVAERVGTRSEKQCRSKWLNYLNWKQSGGTEWTKEDKINLILRIAELDAADENDINWDLLAEGWSSVRSPQWLRSKWWTIKRQIANHKDVSFPVLIKGLKQLHENQKNNPTLLENKSGSGVPNSNSSSSVQHVQIRVARLEDNTAISPSPMAALQIPVQITHVSSTDSPAAPVDSETITLNSGTLQTFEILPPTGTPGTYLLQTSSSQGLPLTLTTSPTLTLTAAAPASPEQIIVHALSPEHLLNTSDNVTVQCHTPRVIIQTVATEDITSSISQAELTVDNDIHSSDFPEPPDALEADTFPDEIHQPKVTVEPSFNDARVSKFSDQNSTELMNHVMVRTEEDLKQEEESRSHLACTYVTEDLESPTIEEQVGQTTIDDETILIVPSPHGFIQASDVIDTESVLPLTTLTDPIFQHHREESNIIGSSLGSPVSEDSKDVEDLVNCH